MDIKKSDIQEVFEYVENDVEWDRACGIYYFEVNENKLFAECERQNDISNFFKKIYVIAYAHGFVKGTDAALKIKRDNRKETE